MRSTRKRRAPRPAPSPWAAERRERLLDGLEEIFLVEGFRRVTVGELAGRLHCSRRALYELAPSKEQLFLVVLRRLLARIRSRGLAAAREEAGLRARLVACFEPGVSELRGASGLFSADVASLGPARRMLQQHQQARIAVLGELIDEGIRTRVFRGVHARLVAEVVLGAVQKVMSPSFLANTDLSLSDAIAEVEGLMLFGLLRADERDGPLADRDHARQGARSARRSRGRPVRTRTSTGAGGPRGESSAGGPLNADRTDSDPG